LASFEIAIAGGDGELAGFEAIAIHGNTHRASGFSPLRTSHPEDFVEPFCLSVTFDLTRAWYDEHPDTVRDLPPTEHSGRLSEIAESRVGATSNENHIDVGTQKWFVGHDSHIGQRLL
jgi:hypothetical protein